jgi:hypothetical protein
MSTQNQHTSIYNIFIHNHKKKPLKYTAKGESDINWCIHTTEVKGNELVHSYNKGKRK